MFRDSPPPGDGQPDRFQRPPDLPEQAAADADPSLTSGGDTQAAEQQRADEEPTLELSQPQRAALGRNALTGTDNDLGHGSPEDAEEDSRASDETREERRATGADAGPEAGETEDDTSTGSGDDGNKHFPETESTADNKDLLAELEKEIGETDPVEKAAQDIVARYNNRADLVGEQPVAVSNPSDIRVTSQGPHALIVDTAPRHPIGHKTDISQERGVREKTIVDIGHIAVGTGDPVFYPERVTEQEAEVLRPAAVEAYAEKMSEYSQYSESRGGPVYDYADPAVRSLAGEQQRALRESGLAEAIVERYRERTGDRIAIDNASTCYLRFNDEFDPQGLRVLDENHPSTPVTYQSLTIPEAKLGLAINGAIDQNGRTPHRSAYRWIEIGERIGTDVLANGHVDQTEYERHLKPLVEGIWATQAAVAAEGDERRLTWSGDGPAMIHNPL